MHEHSNSGAPGDYRHATPPPALFCTSTRPVLHCTSTVLYQHQTSTVLHQHQTSTLLYQHQTVIGTQGCAPAKHQTAGNIASQDWQQSVGGTRWWTGRAGGARAGGGGATTGALAGGGAAREVEPPLGALDHNPVHTGHLAI